MAKCLGGVYTSSHLEQKVDELGQAMMKTLENRFQELNENMETLVRGPQERRPTLASTSPRPSISGVFPHRAAHGSLAAPPGIFIFDDPDSDPRSASLHRQSITALNQQVDTLTQHMNNLDKKLTTMLQRLQVAEVSSFYSRMMCMRLVTGSLGYSSLYIFACTHQIQSGLVTMHLLFCRLLLNQTNHRNGQSDTYCTCNS